MLQIRKNTTGSGLHAAQTPYIVWGLRDWNSLGTVEPGHLLSIPAAQIAPRSLREIAKQQRNRVLCLLHPLYP